MEKTRQPHAHLLHPQKSRLNLLSFLAVALGQPSHIVPQRTLGNGRPFLWSRLPSLHLFLSAHRRGTHVFSNPSPRPSTNLARPPRPHLQRRPPKVRHRTRIPPRLRLPHGTNPLSVQRHHHHRRPRRRNHEPLHLHRWRHPRYRRQLRQSQRICPRTRRRPPPTHPTPSKINRTSHPRSQPRPLLHPHGRRAHSQPKPRKRTSAPTAPTPSSPSMPPAKTQSPTFAKPHRHSPRPLPKVSRRFQSAYSYPRSKRYDHIRTHPPERACHVCRQAPFPTADPHLRWLRHETGGNIYQWNNRPGSAPPSSSTSPNPPPTSKPNSNLSPTPPRTDSVESVTIKPFPHKYTACVSVQPQTDGGEELASGDVKDLQKNADLIMTKHKDMAQNNKFTIDLNEKHPHLSKAPVVEAVIDIRVPPSQEWNETSVAEVLKVKLGETYPSTASCRHPEFKIFGAEGAPPAFSVNEGAWWGIQCKAVTHPHIVQFNRNGIVFSRLDPYESWNQLENEALRLWHIYLELAHPTEIQRLGVRFINRFEMPAGDPDFEDYIQHPPKPPGGLDIPFTSFFHQEGFVTPDQSYKINRIRTLELPRASGHGLALILDIDVSTDISFGLRQETLLEKLAEMRWLKNKIFFGSFTEKAMEKMR